MNKDELLKEIRQMVREGLVLRRGNIISKGTNKDYLYIESLFDQYGEPIFEDSHPFSIKKGDDNE